MLADWQEIREINGSHYLELRNISSEIKRMTANWKGRILSNSKERCYEINTWRSHGEWRERTVHLFEALYPDSPLAFKELYGEIDEFHDRLDGHEKACWEKWNIRPA